MTVKTKTEINAMIGRMYYQAMTDAAGYPNGMAYWEDLTPGDKYHLAAQAIDFLGMVQSLGFISVNSEIGFGSQPNWGEGECKELLDFYTARQASDLAELEQRKEELKDLHVETDENGKVTIVSKGKIIGRQG